MAGRHGTRSPARLGADEFYVLGDNSGNSQDSREWPHPGVPVGDFLGKPFLVHQPLRPGRVTDRRAGADVPDARLAAAPVAALANCIRRPRRMHRRRRYRRGRRILNTGPTNTHGRHDRSPRDRDGNRPPARRRPERQKAPAPAPGPHPGGGRDDRLRRRPGAAASSCSSPKRSSSRPGRWPRRCTGSRRSSPASKCGFEFPVNAHDEVRGAAGERAEARTSSGTAARTAGSTARTSPT